MNTHYTTKYSTEILEREEVVTLEQKTSQLVVFNVDINTFDHVIKTLIEVCNHDQLQAEQCTFIIHFKGKCTVKTGEYEELVPMRHAITDRGISAEVYTD
ncbi:MAG: ATP-dependent Clp protease adaptor ClpS [Bacteroidota bacterium]